MDREQTSSSDSNITPLRDQIFTHKIEQRFLCWYRSFFSIFEIERSGTLQWSFGALLLTYVISFAFYAESHYTTVEAYLNNAYLCWPYFQNCGEYFFLSNLPYGHTQPLLYVFFLGIMGVITYLMWRKDWVLAHMLLSVLFIWKFVLTFFLTASFGGNYDYFDLIFSIILLALPYKIFFLRLGFVFLYFLAATIKLDEGWVLGTYFSSLQTGLPIFPDIATPFITNFVIFMQIIGTWFLLSSNKLLQRGAVVYFLTFHLYSGLIVHYRYLLSTIPLLMILFGPAFRPSPVPRDRRSIVAWFFFLLLLCWQLFPYTIEGDHRMTQEGNRIGLFMFEANHQCLSQAQVHYKNGSIADLRRETVSSRSRCDLYKSWFRINQLCKRNDQIESVAWQFDHSINGGPFYRIVDINNACEIQYQPFSHNEWIKLPKDTPEIIAYPVKNLYF